MTYARIENGTVSEYPLYEGDIRLRFSNTSFPTPFQPPEDYAAVADILPPQVDHTKNVTEGTPQLADGIWNRAWVVSDASADEITQRTEAQWGRVRAKRNAKLAACDWTQLSDTPLSLELKIQWREYRQALRDITLQTDPFNIVWPQEPA